MIHGKAIVMFGILCFTGQLWAGEETSSAIRVAFFNIESVVCAVPIYYKSGDTFADLKQQVYSRFKIKAEDVAEVTTHYGNRQTYITDSTPIAQFIKNDSLCMAVETKKHKNAYR